MKYLKNTLVFIFLMMIILFIISILYYYDIISSNTSSILKIVLYFVLFIISGFTVGIKSKNRTYIEGIKQSFIFIIISLKLSLTLKNTKINLIFYYLLLTIVITSSSIIGINFKKKN